MNKIIGIDQSVIKIGTADGKLIEARREDLNFEPRVGDFVDIYQNDVSLTVVLSSQQTETKSYAGKEGTKQDGSGININISNDTLRGNTDNQPVYVQAGKVVNKVIYILLALFVGGFGVHKFYAGKTGAGVMYILFCWTFIPAIIALFDAISAAMKKADANGNILI